MLTVEERMSFSCVLAYFDFLRENNHKLDRLAAYTCMKWRPTSIHFPRFFIHSDWLSSIAHSNGLQTEDSISGFHLRKPHGVLTTSHKNVERGGATMIPANCSEVRAELVFRASKR